MSMAIFEWDMGDFTSLLGRPRKESWRRQGSPTLGRSCEEGDHQRGAPEALLAENQGSRGDNPNHRAAPIYVGNADTLYRSALL